MSDVVATSQMGLAKEALRNLVAESATFQTAIGATGDAAAKKAAALLRIHKTEYDKESETGKAFVRPFAIVMNTENYKQDAFATSSNGIHNFQASGDLELYLEAAISSAYQVAGQEGNAEAEFENFYDGVLANIMALAGKPGYLAINNIDIVEGPARFAKYSTQEDIYMVRLNVNWGLK